MTTAIPSPTTLARTAMSFPCDDGFAMPYYLARPDPDLARPAVLMVYEAFGLNAEMRRLADQLAAAGFVVMIPDLFARGSWLRCIRALMRDLERGTGRGVDDLLAARRWLDDQPFVVPDRVAIMGLCMGGGFALLLARTGRFRASAPFYGPVPRDLTGTCPVVASYGGRDRITIRDARRLEQALMHPGTAHDVKIYPGVGHSFMNRAPNQVLAVLGRLLPAHAGYAPTEAADALDRLLAFLRIHV